MLTPLKMSPHKGIKTHIDHGMKNVGARLRLYWSLIKSLQTGLLLITGVVGYLSCGQSISGHGWELLGVVGSLFLAISGSTVLNMWYDRDIDAVMQRTCWRPLPAGKVGPYETLILGLLLSLAGVGWALAIDPLYGTIVFGGFFFDVVVYTLWLKRRSPWSIVWGGMSGAMPLLAGRALGLGQLDWIGLLLAAAILFWIPTHILTFAMRYARDYEQAGIPTMPGVYGFRFTRVVIAFSSMLAIAAMVLAAWGVGLTAGAMSMLLVLSAALLILALTSVLRPSQRLNFSLFKYASVYMLVSMMLIAGRLLF
ncbi:MAG: protoheme IX farnesyltransferase [Chloroflexi bacterium]|nr:protoheme IX farnesyltransferase [Chloroflexota bacterium]